VLISFLGYQYCVASNEIIATPTGTTTGPTTSPTGITPPGPTQSGQPSNCNKWHVAVGMFIFNSKYRSQRLTLIDKKMVTTAVWSRMNILSHTLNFWHGTLPYPRTVLMDFGDVSVQQSPCSSFRQLIFQFAAYAYCVGTTDTISSTRSSVSVPAPTTTPIAAPEPNQPNNAISTCNKFAQAQAGDWCALFAERNGVALSDLYAWNAVLGADGSGCGSSFWKDYWYCVGVSASSRTGNKL